MEAMEDPVEAMEDPVDPMVEAMVATEATATARGWFFSIYYGITLVTRSLSFVIMKGQSVFSQAFWFFLECDLDSLLYNFNLTSLKWKFFRAAEADEKASIVLPISMVTGYGYFGHPAYG